MLRRRALIGTIVAILAGGGAASLGSPATAKRDAQCAKGQQSKTKRAKRHAKCKKPKHSKAKTPESVAKADARALLAQLPLPQGAVEVASEPGFDGPAESIGCRPLVDVDRYWHVPGEPRVVVEWIETHRPAGVREWGSSEQAGRRGEWSGSFSFAVKKPDVESPEDLVFEGLPAEGGGTALRADAQVIPADAKCIRHG